YRGCLLAYLGKHEAYRDLTRAMLNRFRLEKDPSILERTAKTCLLLPDDIEDPSPLVSLMDRAVTTGGQYLAWYQLGKTIALYRAAQYTDSLEMAALAEPGLRISQGEVTCQLIRAMALQQLKRAAESRQAFDQAHDILWNDDK